MKNHSESDANAETIAHLQMLQTLDVLRREHKVGQRVTTILQSALADAELPLTRVQCERWLRAICRHADGSDYCKSQRAVFVSELNRVLDEWHRGGLTPERFALRNYRRERQYGLLNLEALEYVTVEQMDALKRQFLSEQDAPKELLDQAEDLQEVFHQFVFAAIAFGGMAWNGVFADLARLQWRHVRTAVHGYLLIPRFGIEQRIHVPPIVQFFALLLGEYLPRSRKKHEPVFGQPILPRLALKQWKKMQATEQGVENGTEDGKDFPKIAAARAKFNVWLADLCRRARLRGTDAHPIIISVQALAAVARTYVIETFTSPIAGALLGLIPYSPATEEQRNIFEEYRRTGIAVHVKVRSNATKPIASRAASTPSSLSEISDQEDVLELMIARLHDAVRPLFGASGNARKRAAQQLEELANSLLGDIGLQGETAQLKIQSGHEGRLANALGTIRDVAHLNGACIALWLADLCRQTNLNTKTIAARRSDAMMILRLFPARCLNELDVEDGVELAGMDRAESSRRRLIGTWHQLHSFLGKQLNLPVEEIDWREFTVARTQRQVNLLGQSGFEKLQCALCEHEEKAQDEGTIAKARDYRNAYFAVILAFYFGARLNETVQLTISDLVIRSQQPYICIWRSKRGKSRIVYARHVPDEILAELKGERDRRYVLTKDMAAPFFANAQGEMTDPKRISEIVIQTLEGLGLRGHGNGLPLTFHSLRHDYANRLMVLGVPLLDIANSMGHASPDTTTSSYLHGFDFLQREQLGSYLKNEGNAFGLSYKALGAKLGIGRTAVLALIARYEKAMGTRVNYLERPERGEGPHAAARRDQRRISDDAVRVLAFRLGLVHSKEIQ